MKKEIIIHDDVQRTHLAGLIKIIPAKHIVTIQPVKGIRRLRANRFYWKAIIEPMAETTGYTKIEMHGLMKKKFLHSILLASDSDYANFIELVREVYRQGLVEKANQMMEYVKDNLSTTRLSIKSFTDYVEQVKQEALELNVRIPEQIDESAT